MKVVKSKLILLVVLLIPVTILSQEYESVKLVNNYLEHNGTMKQYSDAYDNLLNLMEQQYPKSDRNSDGWIYLEKNKTKALFEIRDMLTAVYLQNFTEDDLRQMNAFYISEAGKQLVADRTALTDEHKAALETFQQSAVGQKLVEKQASLTEETQAVSEIWSKDLYQTASLLLQND